MKRTSSQTPEITLISSAQRLAANADGIKTKKNPREENAVIILFSIEEAKPMTNNKRHYTPSRLAKLSGLMLLVTPFFIAFGMTVDLWNLAKKKTSTSAVASIDPDRLVLSGIIFTSLNALVKLYWDWYLQGPKQEIIKKIILKKNLLIFKRSILDKSGCLSVMLVYRGNPTKSTTT